jgi:hypothetical protein
VVDLSGDPEGEAEALRRARAEAQRPFDLTGDTLLRAILLRWARRITSCCWSCITSSPTRGR